MALAYPGEKSTLADHIARDAFLVTLSDTDFLYIVYNFGDIRSSNPRDREGNNCTLLDETAKIGISD